MADDTSKSASDPSSAPIVWTEDGALKSSLFDDIYFSAADGLAETEHVFLRGADLPERFAQADATTIGELGFGTGLNFLAAWRLWRETSPAGAQLHFVSIEKHPLPRGDMRRAVSPWPQLNPLTERLCASYAPAPQGGRRFTFPEPDGRLATLTLLIGKAGDMLDQLEAAVDVWFLDGFAPSKNPDMWRAEILADVARLSAPRARLATFTAAGAVRRGLEAVGFSVEKTRGFGRKRDMTVARFDGPRGSRDARRAPWFRAPGPAPKTARIAVIGAGVAGACAAWHLKQAGYSVCVYDAADGPAARASGNPAGLIMPRLDKDVTPLARFHAASYAYALGLIERLSRQACYVDYTVCGILQIARDGADEARLAAIAQQANLLEPDLVRFVSKDEARAVSGVEIDRSGLFFPQGGVVAPRTMVTALLSGIEARYACAITALERSQTGWRLMSNECGPVAEADIVIIANGLAAKRFSQTAYLPFTGSLGQLTIAPKRPQHLNCAITFGPYIAPAPDGGMVFGATYEPFHRNPLESPVVSADRNVANLNAIKTRLPGLIDSNSVETFAGRADIRCVTPDRAPMAGAVADAAFYGDAYDGLRTGKQIDYPPAESVPGLYVLSGLGSRGLVTAPLLGAFLASEISGAPSPLETDIAEAVHPARFLIRALKRNEPSTT